MANTFYGSPGRIGFVLPAAAISTRGRTQASGLIREVWYGQRSLGQTFWVWNFLVGSLLIGTVGYFLVAAIAEGIDSPILAYLYRALVGLPYSVWVLVGMWRSATNNPGGWATVVKILVVVGVIFNVVILLLGFTKM